MANKAEGEVATQGRAGGWGRGAAHGLGDDLTQADWALLAELAGVLDAWPARNAVARRALDVAAERLQQLAAEEASRSPQDATA